MKESTKNNRLKKEERRNAKALKKAKNTKIEKKSNPNNLLIFLLCVLVIGGVFGGVLIHKWYQKDATIESFLSQEDNSQLAEMQLDEYSTMTMDAKKNDVNLTVSIDTSNMKKDEVKEVKENWNGEDAQKYVKYMASYYLTYMKSNTRALNASVTYDIKIDDESIKSEKLTYRQAKKFMKEQSEEATTTEEEPIQEETQEIELDSDQVIDLDSDSTIEVTPDEESTD